MAHSYGTNFERHPMIAPIWQKLETIEQQLDHLDLAVNTVLKHLNITVPGTAPNGAVEATTTPQAGDPEDIEASDEPYEYKALDLGRAEIRILALKNASDEAEEIRGSIVHLSLEERVAATDRYNALSYTWGEPKMDRQIVIDGRPFFVTKNLESALRQMRKVSSKDAAASRGGGTQSRWWIDQICTGVPQ